MITKSLIVPRLGCAYSIGTAIRAQRKLLCPGHAVQVTAGVAV